MLQSNPEHQQHRESEPTPGPLARLRALADQCVMCGLCLPHCPTYARDQNETASPRGRIALIRQLAAGSPVPAGVAKVLDPCLGCLRCESVCPAQVRYREVIDAARAEWLPPSHRQRWWYRLLASPRWSRMGLRVLRSLPARLLPRTWQRLKRGIDDPAVAPIRAETKSGARGTESVSFVLHPGCAASSDASAQRALLSLAKRAGQSLSVAEPRCCGALAWHAGAPELADRIAGPLGKSMDDSRQPWPEGCLHLVWAAACLPSWQRLLPTVARIDVMAWAAAYLVGRLPRPARVGTNTQQAQARVALHVPCSQRAHGDAQASARLLSDLGVAFQVVQGLGCCGASGVRFLEPTQQCEATSDALLDAAVAMGAKVLLSSNPGCLLLLRARARERALDLRVEHVFCFLDQALGDGG